MDLLTKKFFLFFFLLFCNYGVYSQSFSLQGKVLDGSSGKPLTGASVFLSSTSYGTSTNASGKFTINNIPPGSYTLVISFLGYQTVFKHVSQDDTSTNFTIILQPKTTYLGGITIKSPDKKNWKKWERLFEKGAIGKSSFATQCSIQNKEALHFRYSRATDTLTVSADEPLLIRNNALGYIIKYQLEIFSCKVGNEQVVMAGFPLFKEIKGSSIKKTRWQENRTKVYRVSLLRFMRALYNGSLIKKGYHVLRLKHDAKSRTRYSAGFYNITGVHPYPWLLTADSMSHRQGSSTIVLDFNHTILVAFSKSLKRKLKTCKICKEYVESHNQHHYPTDRNDILSLTLKEHVGNLFVPFYKGFIVSLLRLKGAQSVYIKPNGYFYPGTNLLISGFFAYTEKLGTMLPLDYIPPETE